MQQTIDRATAKAQGLKTYFTGVPCKRGGVAERRVGNNDCLCAACREAAAERNRLHYEQNREAVAERNRLHYEQNREAVAERNRLWREQNREAAAERRRLWREQNREAVAERNRRYREQNREARAEYERRYHKQNPHKAAAKHAKRRATKRLRMPIWYGELDRFVFEEAAALARDRAAATGVEWHVDHMVPLQCRTSSGLHCAHNIQVIPAAMNIKKGNRLVMHAPLEWLRHIA